MAPTDNEAAAALHWVKLQSLPVFWPACVYTNYSDAVEYTHDVWPLRSDKPVLDAEDRVLYFFGVGPRACHVVASGSAPNLQLCVAHEEDLTLEKWTSAEDFPLLCGKYQVPEDLAKRAENNSCFLRACEEAETYAKDVHTKEQASELFVTLLTMAKKSHATGKAIVVREIIPSPAKPQKKAAKKTTQEIEQEKAIEVARMLKTPEMGTMVAKCWQQMLESGWETMAQGDGQVLYKMPGTTFFNLVPNVNLFDSLEKACGRYLSDWVKSVAVDDSSEDFSELTEFLWPMAAGSGWEGLVTTSEILYKKKDLPFDRWVPNVTIFRSKTQAVAKYLEECGLISAHDDSTPEEEETQNNESDSDVDMEDTEQSEDPCQISEVEGGESEGEEDNQKEEAPAAPVKAAKPTKPAKEQQKKYVENMPLFNMSFGKLEAELFRRGWYYKSGTLHYLYYQPYCKTMDSKSLKVNKDYFRGRDELESFTRTSGLYNDVETTLKNEHYNRYILESEEDADSEEETHAAPLAKVPTKTQVPPAKVPAKTQAPPGKAPAKTQAHASKRAPTTSKTVSKVAKVAPNASKPRPTIQQTKAPTRRERTHVRSGSRRTRSKPAPRARGVGLSTNTTLAEVKFGEIWRVLADDGWHYLPGSLEYDYFKPHCETTKDGIPGKDYFQSKDLLIEYLETSGIWDATAARVRAEAAMDSSDEDMIDSDTETATPVQKRKRNESTPAPKHNSKKFKDAFRTPTLKRLATADLSDDDEDMDTISPDAAGTKGKENTGNGRQPLRNLANSFTPSPNTTRKEKNPQHSSHSSIDTIAVDPAKSGPRSLIQSAIQKLTSAYIPTNFRHREKEFREIRAFFSDCFDGKEEKTSLYISGAPGCGKSALLKATQAEIDALYQDCCPDQSKEPVRCHVNAMAIADSSALFCKLAEALTNKSFSNGNEAFEAIERTTTRRLKSSKTMILILDEIDTLLKNNGIESDLCRLFELAHRDSNNFILIGIANQVDFTERHLPMLKQRLPECSPRVVIFEPYKHQTIEQILIDRLGGQATAAKMVSTHGISFLARKIASTTGDIRLAVDTCRRVLQQKLDHANKENGSADAELGRPLPLTDMLRIIKHALESKSALVIRSLPRNLQMILFASTRLLIVTASRAAENGSEATPLFSVDELYTSYCEASKDAGVFKPLSVRDFRTALDTLGEEGLIAEAELRKHLIKLLFSTSELLQSFRKDPFFSRLV